MLSSEADEDQIELDEHVYKPNSTEKEDRQSINRLIHQPEAEQPLKVTSKKKDLIVHFEELSKFRLFLHRMSKVKCIYFGFIVVLVASILVTFFVTKHAHRPGDPNDRCTPKLKESPFLDSPKNVTIVNRLPNDLQPINYDLKIRAFLQPQDRLFYFTGSVSILVNCLKSTRTIQLNANELKIDEQLVHVEDEQGAPVPVSTVDLTNEVLSIELNQKLDVNHNYTLRIPSFRGNLTTSLSGFYRSSYLDPTTSETRYFAMTQFQATDARRVIMMIIDDYQSAFLLCKILVAFSFPPTQAFPCWDEPAWKATFNIELTHFTNMTAIANMPASSTVPLS